MGFLGVRVWPRAKKNHHNVQSISEKLGRDVSTVIKSNFEVVFPFYAALYFDSTTSRGQILSFGLNFLKMNELLKNHLVRVLRHSSVFLLFTVSWSSNCSHRSLQIYNDLTDHDASL